MGYAIMMAIIIAFIAVVYVIARKDARERDEMVRKLSEEQKNRLEATDVETVDSNAWVQEAMVAKMVEKGGKYSLRLLWYNKVLENNEYQSITIADTSISKREQEAYDIKEGDFVKMYFAPEKSVGSVKVVFE